MPPRLAVKPASRLLLSQSQYKTSSHLRRSSFGLRCFGSQRKTVLDGSSFAYTWLTKTPEQITPDDVLSSIPPIPASLAEPGNVPVLFVTPSFAPWIDPSGEFLEQWMNRLFHNSPDSRSAPLHAIAAIIDRIPDSRVPGNGILESEGLSLMFVKEENIQGKAAPPRRIRSTGSEESALIFSVQAGAPNRSGDAVHRPIYEVGLRLANTIFINGNENTLFGMRWALDSVSNKLSLDQSIDLTNCVLNTSANFVHDKFELPLHPVSQRRKVVSSMGNILRQVSKSTDGNSKAPMPASSELEKELPRYIAEHNIEDRRVSVWALVERPDADALNETDSAQDRLDKAIRAGGKLHRVMSGGGGWGKKQGLLSLDPEIRFLTTADQGNLLVLNNLFDPNADTLPGLPPLDKGLIIDDLSLLSQVAREDDYIQFFVSVEPKLDQNDALPKVQEGAISCHFGVLSDPEILEESVDNMAQIDLAALPNYFGALSEKAITYLQPVIEAEGEILESGTKLDVPGSRVDLIVA
ncbi:hypothetical protein MW887_001338 [Aspergillus wentii]|nr:hypothetical protein MW887_001338 [Aspergillus wentii]